MAMYKNYAINSITLTEQERLWKPDLFFRNEKEGHFHKIIMPNVLLRINGDGAVLYSIRISLVLACPMDLKYYPLDKQNCTIEMASYGYLDDDLKFIWKEKNPVQINQPLTLPRFTLETFNTAFCTSRTATGAYSCLRVDLIFKREFSYYLIQIYIPCCMLVIVSWVSFWLDPNAIPARVSLGVTTLLTMATQISGINASLPPVSYTKAIDVWTGVCLTFVFGALLEFALVNYASRSDAHARVIQARREEELRLRELEYQQRQQMAAAAAAAAAQQHQHQQQQHLQAYGGQNGYAQVSRGAARARAPLPAAVTNERRNFLPAGKQIQRGRQLSDLMSCAANLIIRLSCRAPPVAGAPRCFCVWRRPTARVLESNHQSCGGGASERAPPPPPPRPVAHLGRRAKTVAREFNPVGAGERPHPPAPNK